MPIKCSFVYSNVGTGLALGEEKENVFNLRRLNSSNQWAESRIKRTEIVYLEAAKAVCVSTFEARLFV